jgi:hypothetical protein
MVRRIGLQDFAADGADVNRLSHPDQIAAAQGKTLCAVQNCWCRASHFSHGSLVVEERVLASFP